MSNTAKKILQETFSSWMKKITKEYPQKYGFDMVDYKIDYSPSVFRIDNTDLDIEIMNKISKPCQ